MNMLQGLSYFSYTITQIGWQLMMIYIKVIFNY